LKLNDTHQPLFCADDVNTLGGRMYVLKKNTAVLVVARRKNGLEVNRNKIKYMTMSRDQNT
jgi:ribosomal protein L24E